MRSAIGRAILQIIACMPPHGTVTCAPAAGALTLAAGGSIKDALIATAVSFAQMGVYNQIHVGLGQAGLSGAAGLVAKAAVHGVVGGAASVATGGSFESGFASGAVAGASGFLMESTPLGAVPGNAGVMLRTAVAALAGGTASVLSGGKFANGAITGAMAQLFNDNATAYKTLAGRTAVAGGLAGADGPSPVGDILGLGYLLYSIYDYMTYTPADVGTSTDSQDQYVPLYRAVGKEELAYLIATGNYGHSPSMGGKYFALTLYGATAYSQAPFNGGTTVTATSIPQSVLNQGYAFPDPGQFGARQQRQRRGGQAQPKIEAAVAATTPAAKRTSRRQGHPGQSG